MDSAGCAGLRGRGGAEGRQADLTVERRIARQASRSGLRTARRARAPRFESHLRRIRYERRGGPCDPSTGSGSSRARSRDDRVRASPFGRLRAGGDNRDTARRSSADRTGRAIQRRQVDADQRAQSASGGAHERSAGQDTSRERVPADGGRGRPGALGPVLIDLPGYGYARGGASAAEELKSVAEGYFRDSGLGTRDSEEARDSGLGTRDSRETAAGPEPRPRSPDMRARLADERWRCCWWIRGIRGSIQTFRRISGCERSASSRW